MKNFLQGSLEITIQDGDRIQINWIGRSEEKDPSVSLNPYLVDIADELIKKKIDVDFSQLEYMNSSTVSPIIQFIKKINTNECETRILYDKDSKWQSASFKALETIALYLKFIKIVGK